MASTASTNFVTQLFETVLLRQGSASEISSWANVLDGGLTQNEVVTDFVTSVEATTDVLPIVRLYQTFFNRAPDAAGLNFWVNTLRNSGAAGSTGYNAELVSIATFFAGSAESQSLYGAMPAPASFVAALYQDVLGRAPDVAGDQFWINFLTSAGNTPANEALVASFFANSQEFVTDSTAPIEAFLAAAVANGGNYATGVIAGLPNAGSGSGQLPSSTFILTPGADTLTGVAGAQNTFEASLTQFGTDGKGPTLNSTDVITGGGGDNNTLLISDDFGQATDIIPLGIHLSNIQTVSLQTSGNAGSAGTPFSTAGISGVTALTVTSVGTGTDYINAAGTTAITENQRANGGGVSITGGSTVTVTSAGANGVQVGTGVATTDPTGAVKVTDSNAGNFDIAVLGGTDVDVNLTAATNLAIVQIGLNELTGGFAIPTGNVTVADAGGGGMVIIGGVNVSVTTAAGDQIGAPIVIGDFQESSLRGVGVEPTGAVTVTDTAPIAYDGIDFSNGAHNHVGTQILIAGGTSVTVTTNAGLVQIGGNIPDASPTGAVTVTDTASATQIGGAPDLDRADVSVDGGTSVTVAAANAGVAIVDATGAIAVTETAVGTYFNFGSASGVPSFVQQIVIDNGTSVTVSAKGQDVTIGEQTAPTGAVTVTQAATLTGVGLGESAGLVAVSGGTNVAVTTSGGNVQVGSSLAAPTGTITITDTFGGPGGDDIATLGGTTVVITTTADANAVTVGQDLGLNPGNTALLDPQLYATGDITIVNGTAGDWGTGLDTAHTLGGTTVSITGGGAAIVQDEAATVITAGANAGKAAGTGTLTTVTLDQIQGIGTSTVVSDALTTLNVLDSSGTVLVTNHTAGHALALTIGNDAGQFQAEIDDDTAGSFTIGDNGTPSSAGSNDLRLDAETATAITVNNSVSMALALDAPLLKTITVSGAGALDLEDVSGLASLSSIDASASSGAVTVEINPGETSFKGGTGADVVSLSQNTLGAGVTVLGGSSGHNMLVADYRAGAGDTPLGNTAAIKNFQTLALGDNAGNFVTGGTVTFGGTTTGNQDSFDLTISNNQGEVDFLVVSGVTPAALAADFASGLNGLGGIVTAYNSGDDFFTFTDPNGYPVTVSTTSSTVTMTETDSSLATYDASGFLALTVGQTAGDVTFTHVATGATLAITDSPDGIVGYDLQTLAPVNALALTVGVDGATFTGTHDLTATVAAPGIQTVTIDSQGFVNSSDNGGNDITIADGAAKTIAITGDQTLTLHLQTDGLLGQNSSASLVTSINAAGSSGTVDVSDVALAATGGTITGGAGLLIANGVTGVADTGGAATVTIAGTPTGGDIYTETVNGTAFHYTAKAAVSGATEVDAVTWQAITGTPDTREVDMVGWRDMTPGGTLNVAETVGTVTVTETDGLVHTADEVAQAAAGTSETGLTLAPQGFWDVVYIGAGQTTFTAPQTGNVGGSPTASSTDVLIAPTPDVTQITAGVDGTSGSESIGGALIVVNVNGAYNADQVATVAGGGFVSGLTLFTSPTQWTVSSSVGAETDFTSTTPNHAEAGPAGASATGAATAPTSNQLVAGATPAAADDAAAVAAGLQAAIAGAPPAGVSVGAVNGDSFTLTDNSALTAVSSTSNGATATETTVVSAPAGGTSAVDDIITGSGGGDLTLGQGGGWNATLNGGQGAYDVGSETVNLSASAATVDTITIVQGDISTFNGVVGGITGFQVTANAKTSDNLKLGNAGRTALANNGVATSVATTDANGYAALLLQSGSNLTNLTWTSSNGVITFGATGGHNVGEFSTAQLIAAAEIITDEAPGTNTGNIAAAFAAGGNTFVVLSDAAHTIDDHGGDNGNSVVELLGVTGIAGFGTTAAAGTLVSPNIANVDAGHTGTVAGGTINDAGFSMDDFFLNAVVTQTGVTNTYANLAASAQINIDATGLVTELGNLTVGPQAGPSGSNSLTLNFINHDATLDTVTVTGDNAVTLVNGNVQAVIAGLVDTTNTVATISMTGSGLTLIGNIADTALTLVDAHDDIGVVGVVTGQAGLTVEAPTDGNSVFVLTGAGDTITQASGGGSVAVTASGAGDTITLANGNNDTVVFALIGIDATGAGDTITVGIGSNMIVATGAGDTITVTADPDNLGSSAAANTIAVGSDATVTLGSAAIGDAGNQAITVTGAVTGATSSGAVAMTKIAFAASDIGDRIVFDNANAEHLAVTGSATLASALVNMSGVTTLAAALDLAASQGAAAVGTQHGLPGTNGLLPGTTGAIDWFQFGGNTYVVEAVNGSGSPAAHAALGAHDAVVELLGIVDLSQSVFSGHTLTI